MRTNVEIDDELMRQAMAASGKPTKKAVVEEALRLAVQLHRQHQALESLWGVGWEGDLEAMRRDEHLDWDAAWEDTNAANRSSAV